MDNNCDYHIDPLEFTCQYLNESEDQISKEVFVEIGKRLSKKYVELAREIKRDFNVDILERLYDYLGSLAIVDVMRGPLNLGPDVGDLTGEDYDAIVDPFDEAFEEKKGSEEDENA